MPIREGVTKIDPNGNPQLNQVPLPWIINSIKNNGYHIIWMYENVWKKWVLNHLSEVIAIKNIIIVSTTPVLPGILKKSNSEYVFSVSKS